MAALRFMLLVFAVLSASTIAAGAQTDSRRVDAELALASHAVAQGRVRDALDRLSVLVRQLDPMKDRDAYFLSSKRIIELLSETEHHREASPFIDALASNFPQRDNLGFKQWMRFYLGRNLAYMGRADEGEQLLRALTGDKETYVPSQRAGALVLSTIELDRDRVDEAAIWMRRALIGVLVDEGAGSEEILDVLTHYAAFLARTRRLSEANDLFAKLVPLYQGDLQLYAPKYLRFLSRFLNTLTAAGNFRRADEVYETLKRKVADVDVVADSVKEELLLQELYLLARGQDAGTSGATSVAERLENVVADRPNLLKRPRNRIAFSYFALLVGDVDLADRFVSHSLAGTPRTAQETAHESILRSLIAAHRSKFEESTALGREALDQLRGFHQRLGDETSGQSPTLTSRERLALASILALSSPHAGSLPQADLFFQLAQFLNRDKAKLGLNARIARQALQSALQQEDMRTRDRLRDLRDRMIEEAANALLARVLPIRDWKPIRTSDWAPLIRLGEIEDKIVSARDRLARSTVATSTLSADAPIDLVAVQRVLRADEALVLHSFGSGLVTTCVTADTWVFSTKDLNKSDLQQFAIDEKLVSAAVRGFHEPSAALDSSFPAESSFRLYQLLLGGVDACLRNKSHILLATDPDLFSLPWNALLTNPPNEREFRHRSAPWLPKTYALSLLTSVRSLHQLRAQFPPSQARQRFLGIGAPDLQGAPGWSPVAATPLFARRGVANRTAISNLPRLPDAADELGAISRIIGPQGSHILLEQRATERELRKLPLNDYRVVSFATHAVVAGEISGVTEPAIVLTPGSDERNPRNDGLLTATEIANLKLDANLVILSACNTAGSDGRTSGRGLSGLADAFFFAGARALAVTQWAVFSDSAKALGSGLVSRSLESKISGVAEGLRRTMVEYASAAKEDHLAHPRFWAAFVIAGDGAVRLLGDSGGIHRVSSPIKLDWEYLPPSPQDLELVGLAGPSQPRLAQGMQKPQRGEKRAGSYLLRLSSPDNPEIIQRDDKMAAGGMIELGRKIGVLGYYPKEDKSSAVFRLLDRDLEEQWRHVVDSHLWNLPTGMVEVAQGYVLVSVETQFSSSAEPSALILNLVSKSGKAIAQQRYPIPISPQRRKQKNITIDSNGNLIIAIGGTMLTKPQADPASWTNPRTGAKRICHARDATVVYAIEPKTLQLQSQHVLDDVQVVSVRRHDGRLYAAMSFRSDCDLDRRVRLAEVGPGFALKPIFQSEIANSIDVSDFEVTPNHFVLVGSMQVLLPTAVSKETVALEQLANYLGPDPDDDTYWEKGEDRTSAFVLVIGKDGALLADHVFADPRSRSIAMVTSIGQDRFLAVGGAFGDRGWVLAFSVAGSRVSGSRPNGWDRLHPSVQGLLACLVGPNERCLRGGFVGLKKAPTATGN